MQSDTHPFAFISDPVTGVTFRRIFLLFMVMVVFVRCGDPGVTVTPNQVPLDTSEDGDSDFFYGGPGRRTRR